MTPPCFNCDKRVAKCHSSCEDYKAFKDKSDSIRQKINAEREKKGVTWDYIVRRQASTYRKNRGSKGK